MLDNQWISDKKEVDALIEQMNALDDHALVDRLRDCDARAWQYVYLKSVLPTVQRPFLQEIMQDRQRSAIDVFAAVFESLLCRRKLDLYRFGCPLVYWIRFWVQKEILYYCRKNDSPISDEEYESALMNAVAPESNWDSREEALWCLNRLWQEDKRKAKILYLRAVEGKSSREIQKLMGISSEANVDKLFQRALARMREFRTKSEKVNKNCPIGDL